ncbi:Oxygen-independent coproporphyrinogen-III oxidase-like protein [Caulifigura coniformis]|uniref:Heme chaperone HemW n=2 Tax=Caulifigura coniformis TaxID=2527983 RepID=A0A517SHE8_9PLAN|nr:Oxygen-independent coproporphyrinogen-III oxidase-like protein [Caulifigura coniformis]
MMPDPAATSGAVAVAPWGAPRALYVHVPFCRHRCGYCDFTLVAGRDDLIDRYLEALHLELGAAVPHRAELKTLFFGGGTPTHLSAGQLTCLLRGVLDHVRLETGAEFSVEANPLDLTDARIEALAAVGVNRVSVGVQSFQSQELAILERDHSPAEAVSLVNRLKAKIPNVGVDLIFGVPAQTLDDWRRNLDAALAIEPTHLSTYGLTFEKGTAFWSRRAKGQLRQQPEELEREMYALAIDTLTSAGYRHYELSNFARPGFECRHNQVYWNAESYYAIGPGAASYIDGIRRTNHRSTTHWIDNTRAARGVTKPGFTETLSPEDRAREALMLGLRQLDGIDVRQFEGRFDVALDELAGASIAKLEASGWLERAADCLRLTREGVFVADSVVSELLVAD